MSEQRDIVGARLRSAAWVCVVSVLVIAPLVTTNLTMLRIGTLPFTHDQIELPRAVLLHILSWTALAAWALAAALAGARARVHKALWALGAFLGIVGVAALASPYKFTAFLGEYRHYEGFWMFVSYAALAFVAMQLATPSRLTWLARLASVSGTVLALYGISQTFKLDQARWLTNVLPGRAFATWGNPDFFGGYLLFPLAFSLALAFGDESRGWRIAGIAGSAASLAALVATATRGAWIAGAVVLAVMFYGLVRKGHPWKLLALATAGALVASGIAFNVASKGELLARIVTAFTSAEAGVSYQRFGIWQKSWELFTRHPLLGTGPDTMVPASRVIYNMAFSNDAHNFPLQLGLTVGVFGAIAFYVFVVWAAWSSRKDAFSPERGLPNLVLTAAWAASAGYLVHLLVGISMITSTAMLFVCIGVLLGASRDGSFDVSPIAAWSVATVAAILLVVSLGLGGWAITADHAYIRARTAAREGQPDRLAWAERAIRMYPRNEAYARELRAAQRSVLE